MFTCVHVGLLKSYVCKIVRNMSTITMLFIYFYFLHKGVEEKIEEENKQSNIE